MPNDDEELYQYALEKVPELKAQPKDQVIAYARSKIGEPAQGAEFTPAQMQVQPKPELPGYAESVLKGFKQEELPANAGLGRNLAHMVGEEALPTIGAVAGAPMGPAGIMAGAAMGRGLQKGAAAGVRALAGEPASNETPLHMAQDVAQTGVMQGIGQKAAPGMLERGLTSTAKKIDATAIQEVNALIKPKTLEYIYGKNPGKAILEEGIPGGSFKEMHGAIQNKLQELGQMYEPILSDPKNSVVRLNLERFTAPIDEAILKAKRLPRRNDALITRLENTKRDLRMQLDNKITGEVYDTTSFKRMGARKALELKRVIGDATKFTADAQEDNAVNSVLKQMYRYVDMKLDQKIPELTRLNERYANLLGASVAARAKDLSSMNRRQWMPLAEGAAVAAGGTLMGRPIEGAAIGAATAGIHHLAQNPANTVNAARVLSTVVSPAIQSAAQGVANAGATQIPRSIARNLTVQEDPLGLFQ